MILNICNYFFFSEEHQQLLSGARYYIQPISTDETVFTHSGQPSIVIM